jgi:RNA polymerase sigma-B factor
MVPLASAASPPAAPARYDDAALLERYFHERDPRDREALELTESGRPLTVEELARRLDTDIESILEARQLRTAHRAASLDVPLNDDSDQTLIETIATDDDGFQHVEDSAELDRLLSSLPDRERTILRLRFQEDMTQREISQLVGLSQMHVSRLISSSIAELSQLACGPPRPRHRALMQD